jgi:hypothetical protein
LIELNQTASSFDWTWSNVIELDRTWWRLSPVSIWTWSSSCMGEWPHRGGWALDPNPTKQHWQLVSLLCFPLAGNQPPCRFKGFRV